MNRAEKEQYLRDYELLKKQGKPFFPYAVMKDSTMALIVVLVIALLSIMLGAEQGPKVDPTTTNFPPLLGRSFAARSSPPKSVNTRPVRLPPWAAGARPTMRRRAFASPKPGTGRPQ